MTRPRRSATERTRIGRVAEDAVAAWLVERALPIEGPITLALYVTGALLAYAGCMTLIDREAVAKLRRFLGGTS